jgi:hypothetical protein
MHAGFASIDAQKKLQKCGDYLHAHAVAARKPGRPNLQLKLWREGCAAH